MKMGVTCTCKKEIAMEFLDKDFFENPLIGFECDGCKRRFWIMSVYGNPTR